MINETKLLSWITRNKFKAELPEEPFINTITAISVSKLIKYIHSNKESILQDRHLEKENS